MIQREPQDGEIIRFGEIEIDPGLRQIRYCDAVVAVEPKPFELLVYLFRHRDRVVRREELMEAIWPGIIVSESTLSSAVRRARAAIGSERERILSLRKIGYRFVADEAEAPPNPGEVFVTAASQLPYIGRAAELAMLTEAVGIEARSTGGFVMLAGEAGVGKSRTIAELTERARAIGFEILVGRCYEGEGGQAFWPWVQVFRSFAARRSEADLMAVLAAEASDISRLTAAVAIPTDAAQITDPEMQRARLLDSAVAVFRRAAAQRPLLLILDDLHWADTASLTLLRALALQSINEPIVVVGAYRDAEVGLDHPLTSLLATLRRERAVRGVTLTGLTRPESATLLASLAMAPVDDSVAAAVFEVSEGNPFFLGEYWRDLTESDSLVHDESGWRWRSDAPRLTIPETVVETIRRRLQRLSSDSAQLLALAAVIGREFDHEMISAITTSPPATVIDNLDEAVSAGVIDEDGQSPGRYRFVHALVREALYDGMSGLRRAVLHRSVGEALEKRGSTASPDLIAELAHHFVLAAPAGTIDKAIDYSERAAAAAIRACAYDVAVRYLEQAVSFAEARREDGTAARAFRCKLQLSLAEALGYAGDGARMRATFEQAATLARAIPAPALLARAAIGMTARWVPDDHVAVRLLEEALAATESNSLLWAQLAARLAKTLYLFECTRERREQLCNRARDLAAGDSDPRALGEVLADTLEALFHSDNLSEHDALAAELRAIAGRADDVRLRLLGGAWQIVNSMRHGLLNDADRQLQAFSLLATELRQPRFLHHALAFDAALLLARGQLSKAEARIDEAFTIGARVDEPSARWLHWGQLHHLRREQGRLAEFLGEGLALRLPPGTQGALAYQRSLLWAAPHVFTELGREAEAKASFDALLARGLEQLPPENGRNTRIPALFALADTCVTAGDEKVAAQLYELLVPYIAQWHTVGWGSIVFASTHIMLGVLSSMQQRWPQAEEHFEEALRQHREQGATCAEARTHYQHARALQRRGRRADAVRARRMIEEGMAIAERYGLTGVLARFERLAAS